MIKTLKSLWKYSSQRHNNLIKALICALINSALGITQILAIIKTVQVILGVINVREGLIWLISLTIICVVGNFIASYFEQINALESSLYSIADQRIEVAKRLRFVPLGFFQKTHLEHIIAVLTSTLEGIEMASTMTIVMVVSSLFNTFAMFIFMLFYNMKIGLIVGAGIFVYLLVVQYQMHVSYVTTPTRQKAQTELASSALTFLQGIRVIKTNSFKHGDEHFNEAIKNSSVQNIALTNHSMPSQIAAHLSIAIFESLILWETMNLYLVENSLDIETTIVLLIFSFFAFAALNQGGSILSMIGMIQSGLDEVGVIKETPILDLKDTKQTISNDQICVNDVSFAYQDNLVLKHINATFEPNTLTAIIGPSGAGKTTLCRLLARYEDVKKGSITIGGVDIKDLPYESLMEKISIVFQNVYLFEDTILNNLLLAKPDASMEEVKVACKAARCDEFIEKLPNGYQTLIGEGGNSLSGGEKQRISIARAFLKDSPIIILDEATSALDANNEHAFFEAIDELIKGKTVIMIAHRLSTLKYADKIIAIKNGEVVQTGKPSELANVEGLYADFLKSREEASTWSLHN